MADNASKSTVEITGDIVAAYLGNNTIGAAQLPELIEAVHKSLSAISAAPVAAQVAPSPDTTTDVKRRPGRPRKVETEGREAQDLEPAKTGRRAGRPAGDPAVPIAEVRHAGLHRLPRGREAAQDAEALPEYQLRHDARGLPAKMGIAARLPDGGGELFKATFRSRQAIRPGPEGLSPPVRRVWLMH